MSEQKSESTREAWVLCLILGVIMLNFPFLQIFNTDGRIWGIPILVFYFFIGWPASIVVIFLFASQLSPPQKKAQNEENQ